MTTDREIDLNRDGLNQGACPSFVLQYDNTTRVSVDNVFRGHQLHSCFRASKS